LINLIEVINSLDIGFILLNEVYDVRE